MRSRIETIKWLIYLKLRTFVAFAPVGGERSEKWLIFDEGGYRIVFKVSIESAFLSIVTQGGPVPVYVYEERAWFMLPKEAVDADPILRGSSLQADADHQERLREMFEQFDAEIDSKQDELKEFQSRQLARFRRTCVEQIAGAQMPSPRREAVGAAKQ